MMNDIQYSSMVSDHVLVILSCLIPLFCGIFFAWWFDKRDEHSTREFVLANENASIFLVAISLIGSFVSASTILGVPAEIYQYGFMYMCITLSYPFVIFVAAQIFVSKFSFLKVTSIFEYLEVRFNKPLRTVCAIIFVLQMHIYLGIEISTLERVLSTVTQYPHWIVVTVAVLFCVVNVTMGGTNSVIYTNVAHVATLFAILVFFVFHGSVKVGGYGNAQYLAGKSGRITMDEFGLDPSIRHSFWSTLIGGFFTWLSIYGTNQVQVQLTLSAQDITASIRALWLTFFGMVLVMTILALLGIIVTAHFLPCDPLTLGSITRDDQLLLKFIMDTMREISGTSGLFVVCLLSATFSTFSCGLHSISVVIIQDIMISHFVPAIKDHNAIRIWRVTGSICGFLCLGVGTVMLPNVRDVMQTVFSIFGMLGGPVFGVFILGFFCPCADVTGAFAGLFSSLILTLWIGIGASVVRPQVQREKLTTWINLTHCVNPGNITLTSHDHPYIRTHLTADYHLYKLSYLYYTLVAVLTVIVIGLLATFFSGRANKSSDIHPDLILSVPTKLCAYLPERCQRCFCFDFSDPTFEDVGNDLEEKASKVVSNKISLQIVPGKPKDSSSSEKDESSDPSPNTEVPISQHKQSTRKKRGRKRSKKTSIAKDQSMCDSTIPNPKNMTSLSTVENKEHSYKIPLK